MVSPLGCGVVFGQGRGGGQLPVCERGCARVRERGVEGSDGCRIAPVCRAPDPRQEGDGEAFLQVGGEEIRERCGCLAQRARENENLRVEDRDEARKGVGECFEIVVQAREAFGIPRVGPLGGLEGLLPDGHCQSPHTDPGVH